MNAAEIIERASAVLMGMAGKHFDQLTLHVPSSQFEALNMLKITSKISPLVGNLFEIDATELLKQDNSLGTLGEWIRQDPDFPDVMLNWDQDPKPGFEVKAWYPMSTEITGRFKDSQNAFVDNAIHVVLFAWLPEHVLWGKPKIIKIAIVPGRSIAAARDDHYHHPPDYLVIEPRDTSRRTRNLQQRNTSGYKWQDGDIDEAARVVASWGKDGARYKPTRQYNKKLAELRSKFTYRLDTNYAKMDRVVSAGVENFKKDVLAMIIEDRKISEWIRAFRSNEKAALVLKNIFGIPE